MEDHKVVDSKFRLVILASKRAKQLLRGAKRKVDLNAENPLSIALEEIKDGKIDYEIILTEDEKRVEAGEELVSEENEISEESLLEPEPEESVVDDEDDETDAGDVEAVAQVKDNPPD